MQNGHSANDTNNTHSRIDYSAIRDTLNGDTTMMTTTTMPIAVPQEARPCDKAAMDFFKDAANAAFNQFGGKTNSTFRTISPRPTANGGGDQNGTLLNGGSADSAGSGKVIIFMMKK